MDYIGLINIVVFLICFGLFILGAILTVGALIKMVKLKIKEKRKVKHSKER